MTMPVIEMTPWVEGAERGGCHGWHSAARPVPRLAAGRRRPLAWRAARNVQEAAGPRRRV